jgi:FKBP-type peptidyl-prolyl cis-trans isomerase
MYYGLPSRGRSGMEFFFDGTKPLAPLLIHFQRMKSKHTLITLVLVLSGVAVLSAQEVNFPPAGAPKAAASAQPQFSEAQVLQALGWFISKQNGFAELGFSKEQMDEVAKGVLLAAAGKELPSDPNTIGPEVGKLMQAKQQVYLEKLKVQGKVESDKFFAEVKTRKGVIALPSGLAYEIVKPGAGDFPKATDTVKVHYTGTLLNGTKFDSSIDRGEPAEFALDGVIPGWTEGIQKINKGGKIKLYIPSQLAYGENGNQGIPPNSTLIFDVELLEIKAPTATLPGAAKPETKK